MKLTKDPAVARKAIADLTKYETVGIQIPIENLKKYLYQNSDLEFELILLKEQYPDSYYSVHLVNNTYFIVAHVPTTDGIINIPYWDTSKTVEEIASQSLSALPV